MLVHSFSAMVSCFTFLSEGVRCALGVAIVVGGGSGGFAPSFPERAFSPFLHFCKFGGLHFFPSVFIFPLLPSPSPPFLFFFFSVFLVCFERTAKGFTWTLPLRFLHLATCKRNIFAFSFPFFGTVPLPFEFSSAEAIPFAPDGRAGSSARPREPAEPCRNARASFGAARPSGRRRFPGCCRIPPLPRRPGRRCPRRSQIRASPAHRDGSPRTWGTVAVLSPRSISKTRGGNDRFVWSLISASSGNKMAVGLDFPGFSWDAIGNVSDGIYLGSVKGQRKDFGLWQNYCCSNARL